MSTNKTSTSSVSFAGLLTLLFIGLKLGGVIAWSWWWVLAPLWASLIIAIIIIAIIIIAFVMVMAKIFS